MSGGVHIKDVRQFRCPHCSGVVNGGGWLTAVHPFQSTKVLQGCPHCCEIWHTPVLMMCSVVDCQQDVAKQLTVGDDGRSVLVCTQCHTTHSKRSNVLPFKPRQAAGTIAAVDASNDTGDGK